LPEKPQDLRFERTVTVTGTMKIVDHEDIFANEVCRVREDDIRRVITLDSVSRATEEFVIQRCCGDEVVGKFRVRLRLNPTWSEGRMNENLPVFVSVNAELHESTDCDTDEKEDGVDRSFEVPENSEGSIEIDLSNGPNKVDINLSVRNDRPPTP
jgi:hypothetical protein